jgi:rare lipoprotein A
MNPWTKFSMTLVAVAVLGTATPALADNGDDALVETGGVSLVETIQVAALPLPPLSALIGTASWYGGHHVGRHTASGEIHSAQARTAAHRDLPLGTIIRVTNLKNGRASVVKVNDRGPFVEGRILDLSERAARDLAMVDDGLAQVRIEVVSR